MKPIRFFIATVLALCACAMSLTFTDSKAQNTTMKIFVLAGQSNMSGYAPVPAKQEVRSNIKLWNNGWATASEPTHGTYASPGMGFALTLQDLYGASYDIGLIPCAVSGSSIESWQKGQPYYNDCLNRTLAALATQPGTYISGVLFAQGEANTYTQASADGWNALALAFARDFRTDSGNLAVPFLYAQLGADPQLSTHPYWTYLQGLQATLQNPAVYPYIRMVKTSDLPINQQHFANAETYSIVGRRFASVYFANFGQ